MPRRLVQAFDVDGTLIDTRTAVECAYAEVGVEMPIWAWGRPWREWLPQAAEAARCSRDPQELHQSKNEVYPRHLAQAPVLPAVEILRRAYESGDRVVILTGASERALEQIMKRLDLHHSQFYCVRTERDWSGKVNDLRGIQELSRQYQGGVYYDDDADVCGEMRNRLRSFWTICHVGTP